MSDDDDDSVSSADEGESTNPKKKTITIDGTIALKMQDAAGDTPLHLAAKNQASLDMLEYLVEQDPEAVTFPGNKGDLPIHHLLDKKFFFVNVDLASTHGRKSNEPAYRERVRELAKKQTVVTRLQKFNICGAIFAPGNGWTTEDEENSNYDVMRKVNLLGMAIVDDQKALSCIGSDYGLNCLQIMVAFNAAPYKVIKDIIGRNPASTQVRSTVNNYTALDMHCLRRTIPNEVRKEENDVSMNEFHPFNHPSLICACIILTK